MLHAEAATGTFRVPPAAHVTETLAVEVLVGNQRSIVMRVGVRMHKSFVAIDTDDAPEATIEV